MDNNTDDFLQGKIKLFQPTYKATSDAVFLASAVVCPTGKILDVGTGNGVIAAISAFHNPNASVTGLDINADSITIAERNADLNNLSARFITADIKENPLKDESFDVVVSNPPFFKNGTPSISKIKKLAHHEGNVTLSVWINYCVRRLAYKGFVYLVTDTARVSEIMVPLAEKCGGITLFPLYSKKSEYPKRMIIRARKESHEPFVLAHGLVVHNSDGTFTDDANAILRGGEILRIK